MPYLRSEATHGCGDPGRSWPVRTGERRRGRPDRPVCARATAPMLRASATVRYMTTVVPRSAVIRIPLWFWGGQVPSYFSAAQLHVVRAGSGDLVVEAEERRSGRRPGLVQLRDLAGPALASPNFDILTTLDREAHARIGLSPATRNSAITRRIQELVGRTGGEGVGGLSAGLSAHQLQTITATTEDFAATVQAIHEDIRDIRLRESGEQAYPNSSTHLVYSSGVVLHRAKLASVLLRIGHDERLRSADLAEAIAANARGEVVFAASGGLNEGIALLDAYMAPLLGAMSPFVWAVPATRASGTIIYALGTQIRGTEPEAAEPLHLLPSRGAAEAQSAPTLATRSASAAIKWWTRRLDTVLSIFSDLAVYTDTSGLYVPSKHLHAQLSVDQLFRRVGSIQKVYRDSDARNVLLFTALDTLNRLTSRTLSEMCTLQFAQRTLRNLETKMSAEVAALLLPGARRAVAALAELQNGFFLARQSGTPDITFVDEAGVQQTLTLEAATAEYVRVLRNATHGHGSNRKDAKLRTDALLAHHNGYLPHDLGLLAYLYLLDMMSNPDSLRRTLYDGGSA